MQFLMIFCASVVVVESRVLDFMNENKAEPCGVEASTNLIHHNPWLVLLEYYKEGEKQPLRCGATLIGKRHVVTAAHCVKASLSTRLVARLGEYDLNTEPDCVQGVCADAVVRINVVEVHIPEGFDGSEEDIAVLELEHDAPYTDFIRPVCLPSGTIQHPSAFAAAGWGEQAYSHVYSHVKKIILLPHWHEAECRRVYRSSKLPQKIICAGGEEGVDTCRGDSGGPLTLTRGTVELWGVTSAGNVHCGTKGSPGIYTSVRDHLDWISSVIAEGTD